MAITPLQDYEKSCNRLKNAFLKSLYPNEPEHYEDGYWIGDVVGEVFSWGDWFVDACNMGDYFRHKLTPDEFFEWYELSIDDDAKKRLSMKAFKHLKK